MAGESRSRQRYGKPFWRAHHEAWRLFFILRQEPFEQGILAT